MSDKGIPRTRSGFDTAESTRPKPVESIFQTATNLAALGAILLTSFALVKAYAVSGYSLTTGSALLTSAPVAVLLGSLMSYAYWIFPLASLASLWRGLRMWHNEGWGGQTTAFLGVAVFTALLAPVRNLLWTTIAFLAFITVFRLPALIADFRATRGLPEWTWSRPWVGLARMRLFSTHLFFVAAVFRVIGASLSRPWIPVEIVKVQVGQEQQLIVGSVFASEGDWTTIMRAGDRGLTRIRSDDVLTRQLCHLTGAQPRGQAPLLWTLTGRHYQSPNHSCSKLVDQESSLHVAEGSFPN